MSFKVYEVVEKAISNGKMMKSLVLQEEGKQYPIKNVALWSDNPLYKTIQVGQTIDVQIIEKDSTNPNPHKPGTFFKNRSISNTVQSSSGGSLEDRVVKLERDVFALKSHFTEEPAQQGGENQLEEPPF